MSDRDPDLRAIYILLMLTTLPVVIATLVQGDPFGGGATLSLVLALIGIVGLLRQLRAAPRIPAARVRRSERRRKR